MMIDIGDDGKMFLLALICCALYRVSESATCTAKQSDLE